MSLRGNAWRVGSSGPPQGLTRFVNRPEELCDSRRPSLERERGDGVSAEAAALQCRLAPALELGVRHGRTGRPDPPIAAPCPFLADVMLQSAPTARASRSCASPASSVASSRFLSACTRSVSASSSCVCVPRPARVAFAGDAEVLVRLLRSLRGDVDALARFLMPRYACRTCNSIGSRRPRAAARSRAGYDRAPPPACATGRRRTAPTARRCPPCRLSRHRGTGSPGTGNPRSGRPAAVRANARCARAGHRLRPARRTPSVPCVATCACSISAGRSCGSTGTASVSLNSTGRSIGAPSLRL